MFRIPLLGSLAALALTFPAVAQTTILSEDFNAGLVPPPGWTEFNNGVSAGWEPDLWVGSYLLTDNAWHDDYFGANDNSLMTPVMDLSALSAAGLHFTEHVRYASWRQSHWVDVSLDGGATFLTVLDDTAPDGLNFTTVDLSAYVGLTSVNVAFHYLGDFASEWRVDDVLVNDDPNPPPPPPTAWAVNLPASFVPANMAEDFEGYGGTIPGHMAVTANDAATGLPDPEAWCNVGQLGASTGGQSGILAHSGQYCLEMGLDPNSTNYHQVRNSLVIGLDGSAAPNLLMDFWAVDHGEESDLIDGAWVSDNGSDWYQAWGDWSPLLELWQQVTGADLAATPAVTSGNFYLMFGQEDNFPMGYLDGVQVDDIVIGGPPPGPTLAVIGMVGGGVGQAECNHFTPGGLAFVSYSLAGPGPTTTPWGVADIGQPFRTLAPGVVDPSGYATFSQGIPSQLSGSPIWIQALDLGSGTLSNPLAETIL